MTAARPSCADATPTSAWSTSPPARRGATAIAAISATFVPAFQLGGTIETTGAGDTFCACVLHFVLARGVEGLGQAELEEMLRFANAAAYLVTTRKGAIRSMPERAEVERLLARIR